jgi:putative sporulation protein YtaF
MLWLSVALIAVVSNLDNLAAGVALGMRDSRVSAAPNAVIAGVTMAATAVTMTPGRVLSHVIPPSVATAIGASVISGMGAWAVFTSIPRERMPQSRLASGIGRLRSARSSLSSELPRREVISSRDALFLGVALAANNVATGVGAGIAGVPPVTTTLLAGALSLLCVGGGSKVGLSLGRLIGATAASLMSGLILLGVGAAILAGAG